MAHTCSRVLSVLAALPLLLATSASAKPGDAPFCRKVVATLLKCPVVPTDDSVDLNQYTGRWFGVGVNAQFAIAFFGQQAGQCATPNYTALGVVDGKNSFSIVNRALGLITPQRQAQAYAISQGSFLSGTGVKLLCQFLVGEESLSSLFPAITQVESLLSKLAQIPALKGLKKPTDAQVTAIVQGLISAVDQLPPQYKEQVAAATAGKAQAEVKAAMGQYSKSPEMQGIMKESVGTLYKMSGMPKDALSTPISVSGLTSMIIVASTLSDTLTPTEKTRIKAETVKILTAIDLASASASAAYGALAQAQQDNNVLTGSTLPTPYSLPDTLASIQTQTKKIDAAQLAISKATAQILASGDVIKAIAAKKDPAVAKSAGGIALLAGEGGPLSLTTREIGAGGTVISVAAKTVTPEELQNRLIEAIGTGAQSTTNAGALTVGFGNGPLPSTPNYNIIKLVGPAAKGYDLAIVFNCNPSFFTAFLPQNSFFILSRTPVVPQSVLDASVAFGEEQGIFLGGENTLLAIAQDPTLCKPLLSL